MIPFDISSHPLCPSKHPRHGQCSLQVGHQQVTTQRRHVAFVTRCGVGPETWTDEEAYGPALGDALTVRHRRTTEEARLALRHISGFPNTFREQDILSDVLEERDILLEQIAAARRALR